MIVNEDYLRIDEGDNSENFVLFDRRVKRIQSVDLEDNSMTVIENRSQKPAKKASLKWDIYEEESRLLPRNPDSSRSRSRYFKYSLQGKTCMEVISLNSFLPEVVIALSEYQETLADYLLGTVSEEEIKIDYCNVATKILDPNKLLETGFPYRMWNGSGYQRFLIRFEKHDGSMDKLFKIPDGVRSLSLRTHAQS